MERVDIKVTYSCNNNCQFCVQGINKTLCNPKTGKEIRQIIASSKKIGQQQVVFTGGEATLRPDIVKLVAYAKKLGYNVQIQTNGRMFAYIDFAKAMVDAGADTFAVSIHGHNAKLHDSLTRVKGGFGQTVLGINNLLNLRRSLVTNTVINSFNYRFLPEIALFLINLGVKQYQLAFPHILGNAFLNRKNLIVRKAAAMPFVIKALEIGISKNVRALTEAIPHCFLKGYEKCSAERFVPDTKVYGATITEDFLKWRREEGKIKGPGCHKCKFYSCCEGPWKEYPMLYGWSEFISVK